MRSFDYRTAARFWGIDDAKVAFHVHAVIGGTPGYRDLIPTKTPSRMADFARWLEHGVLNPASAIFGEDDYLLTEERSLSDRAPCHAVVGAISAGKTSQARIAAAVGRENRAVLQHPLKRLEDTASLSATMTCSEAVAPSTASPIRSCDSITPWSDPISPASRIGASMTRGQTPSRGSRLTCSVATEVAALGEAKHTRRKRTTGDLERLVRIRSLLAGRGLARASTKLLLFSATGFDRNLVVVAGERADVELVDLERMYTGN